MRDRLIKLLQEADKKCKGTTLCETCIGYAEGRECINHLSADYLLSNGVIVPPCKVGDSCYPLPRCRKPIVERKVSRITFSKRNVIIGYYENDGQYRPPLRTRVLGEDIFLTKEEAEAKMKGGE
jgi:hypothetical protein